MEDVAIGQFCISGNRSTLSAFPPVVLRLSISTVEETDVPRRRKNGSPQAVAYRRADRRRDSSGVRGRVLLAALPAAAATGCSSGSATPSAAAGAGCPRVAAAG